jgi:cell division protein FtsX
MTSLPGPGEYYASPALSKLIQTLPADELAARYPGRLVGTIGDAALPGPESLVVVIGRTPAELAGQPRVAEITSIMNVRPDQCASNTCEIGTRNSGMILILTVVALALILPVAILIGTATRLAATRREQRFAAMRLVGATPRQVSIVSAVESTVASVIGTVLGFGVFFAFRPVLVRLNLTGTHFFTSDLSLTVNNVVLVALGVPIASAISARIALRRVQISPLGVTRRSTPKPPRAWRLIPVAGWQTARVPGTAPSAAWYPRCAS